MELQIQDLVSSIKKEGVDVAKKEADKIISDAQNKAKSIIEKAEQEAKKTLEGAQKDIDVYKNSALISADHAKRDAMLALKEEFNKTYKELLDKKISKLISADKELSSLIHCALEGKDLKSVSVEVSKVTDSLKADLAEELKNGLVIRPVSDLNAGFRLVYSDGSGYFDCSDEELAEIVSHYLGF